MWCLFNISPRNNIEWAFTSDLFGQNPRLGWVGDRDKHCQRGNVMWAILHCFCCLSDAMTNQLENTLTLIDHPTGEGMLETKAQMHCRWTELGSGSLYMDGPDRGLLDHPPSAAGITCHTQTANKAIHMRLIQNCLFFKRRIVFSTEQIDEVYLGDNTMWWNGWTLVWKCDARRDRCARWLRLRLLCCHIRKWGSDLLLPLIYPQRTWMLYLFVRIVGWLPILSLL